MSTAKHVQEYVQTASTGASWCDRGSEDWRYSTGVIRTEAGYVEVYLYDDPHPVEQVLHMMAVVDGQKFTRREYRTRSRAVTKRGAQIIAGRWIRGLVGGGDG